ncbi:uncharacterized protein LOC112508696 [Cynara cardunculus var. scolymus]|uniref:uncharacterized protein LOC112508696 n=1 Tax=Cynara cardunculus var. scolymus TaxID=59895 RepID=UPI000D6283D8|nr:uncharacterized protein LOC112508696 [Cynara cardunculus var. scolymus]
MDGSIVHGSESKKRYSEEFEEEAPSLGPKRAKIRDLESVFRSEGKIKTATASPLDLNASAGHLAVDDAPSCVEDTCKLSSLQKPQEMESKNNCVKPSGFGIDLNSEDVSSSISHDPFHPYKDYDRLKARDASSECGSSCHLGGEKDSMKVWKEMKQNGFLSSSHGGVPVPPIPKSRGRKRGNESVIKKKIEIAKKEQVDRFAKVAAPSGLLNELNPGIINHVRNRKQVHSIIENLVRSAKTENKQGGSKPATGKESYDHTDLENGVWNPSYGCQSDEPRGHNDREAIVKTSHHPSYINLECEDDRLALKLSSSATITSANLSSLSNEESGNISTVNSLSFKAASVASQWLELLHQDIKGRLAALRRSKKRVRSVIQTELPSLVSRELVSDQENDCYAENGHFNKGTAELHRVRWGTLFDQMDNALSEEEKHLESSLNQVNEMMVHCGHGLLQFRSENDLQQRSSSDYRHLKMETNPYKDLAVQAAAAAIYSTSNFLQSMENLPCL